MPPAAKSDECSCCRPASDRQPPPWGTLNDLESSIEAGAPRIFNTGNYGNDCRNPLSSHRIRTTFVLQDYHCSLLRVSPDPQNKIGGYARCCVRVFGL
jgi:hypothetical protein